MLNNLRKYLQIYSISRFILLIINVMRTRLFYHGAKIIRFPIDIRGRKFIKYGVGFTTGKGCRLEAYPEDNNATTIIIGNNVQLNDYVHITGGSMVLIGNNVLIASKVYISDSVHGSYLGDINDSNPLSIPKERKPSYKKVIIEDNVWVGESVSILPGVIIGEGSIIGANSVVTKSIPKHVIAAGNPARIIKKYNFNTNIWEAVNE